jgi:hypothetical protein
MDNYTDSEQEEIRRLLHDVNEAITSLEEQSCLHSDDVLFLARLTHLIKLLSDLRADLEEVFCKTVVNC